MRILVSNDDGVLAPGLHALSEALKQHAHIEVMAPDRNRSGASNALTLLRPLRVKKLDNGYHMVDGTPTDCVHLGLKGYFEQTFDMVVSGINDGCNLGDDVLYSGTVAAAMEGRHLGLPAIAVSCVGDSIAHYDTAAQVTRQLVLRLSTHRLPSRTILNVNVPDLPLNEIRGLQVTRLGTRHASGGLVQDTDPRGRAMYWIGTPGLQADAGQGTDFHAVEHGYVSVTPIHMDMTNYKLFDQLSHWMDGVVWQD